MKKSLVGALCAVAAAATLSAQKAPPAADLAFDVATIKINRSNDTGGSFGVRPGGVVLITNNTLRNIVRNTYGVQNTQIAGGPEWFDSTRFDITAKAPGGGEGIQAPERVMAMMQRLLAERFTLVVRREMRPTPVYALIVARGDGRLGPQLRKATVDCQAIVAEARARNAQPVLPPPVGNRPTCGTRTAPGTIMAAGVQMTDIARNLERPAERIVVDKTGLTGPWDLDLTYHFEGVVPPGVPPPANTPDTPSLFAAVQEQLGLKLESQTVPIEMLVVESAQMPTED
jgi:uncharacterized protein (TIGR03435 family)